MLEPLHPGAILKETIEAIPMSQGEFADHIGVSRITLSHVLNEHAGITAEMSIRLADAFGQPSKDFWFKLQNQYDFWHAEHNKSKARIKPIERLTHC